MSLKLAIRSGSDITYSAEICWSFAVEKRIVPKRPPDDYEKGAWKWKLSFENRRLFIEHSISVTESMCDAKEELYGYYALCGAVAHGVEDFSTQWWIVKTRKDVMECQFQSI